MQLAIRIFQPFILCLFFHLSAFAVEGEEVLPDYVCLEQDPRDEPILSMPEECATLTSAADHLIGGLISPLSGHLYLKQADLTVVGAQEIPLSRIYIDSYMPYLFHKHFDRDCFYRREYIQSHYKGWKYHPHLRLWFEEEKNEVHLINPDGTAYDFSLVGSKATLLHPFAVNNLGGHEIPSGKYDPRNTRLSHTKESITVISPDGTTRYYEYKKDKLYLLKKEQLLNGKILKYHYTDIGKLSRIESLDPKEKHIYAFLDIEDIPRQGASRISLFHLEGLQSQGVCYFTSSTGLKATYTFENPCVRGKFRERKKRIAYIKFMPRLLTSVSSPQYKEETSDYRHVSLFLHSFSGKDAIFTLNRSPFGTGQKRHFRVDQLLLPLGNKDAFVPVYNMTYDPAIAGEKEGITTVQNSDGTKTVYHFSKNLLTTSIQYFGEDSLLKKEKIFIWDANHWLSALELRDGKGHLFFRKSYKYDDFGNPILETFTGDLCGEGNEDSYSIKRAFSQDGRNLLLREETEAGKITTFEYLPQTNLLTQKLTKQGDLTLIRECFKYDQCHNLIQKSIDDCSSFKRWTDYHLRQQEPFFHMPEWIEEKYLDQGEEKLLKRTHLTYDQYGNVAEEKIYDAEDTYAYTILREYNEQGNLLSETNPRGQKRTFVYDKKGQCLEETNFSQKLKELMSYDTKGRLSGYKTVGEDGNLHNATYKYDTNDNLIQKVDSYHNTFSYAYDPIAHKVIKTDSPPILTVDGEVNVVSTSSTYDALGREITKTDANGKTTFYQYNAYGFPVEITHPNGSKELYRYRKDGKIASYTDREGLTITYSHDILGHLVSKDYGAQLGAENYIYDSFHLLEKTDLEGNTTYYSYDGAGRKIQEEICGRVTEYNYDSLGRVSTVLTGALKTHFKRDFEGRVLEESKTDSEDQFFYKIGYQYNEDGALSSITRYIDDKEAVESYNYDSFGRKIESQDPYGYKTTTFYDENHRNSLGHTVLAVATTNPKGITIIETKDPFLRTVKEETLNPQGATIACSEKYYDTQGNMIDWKEHIYKNDVYQKTQWTHFSYTNDNTIASITRAFGTPDARTTYYTYTPSGKVATKTLADQTTLSYTYNALGYLNGLSSSDGKIQHHFACDKNGKLLLASDTVDNISIQREVDPFGNVTREIFPNHIEVTKNYDDLDRLTCLHLSNIGEITYTYNPLFLKSVSRFSSDGTLEYTHHYDSYDLDGNLLSEKMIHNSGQITHHHDLKGRKTAIYSPYFSQNCLYDSCDNLIENTIDAMSIAYTYDALNQLTSEDEHTYGYDSLLNRIQKDDTHFQTNHLNELDDQNYDLNGNQIQKENTHYTYDPLNRLIEATSSTKKIRFLYDPLGRRLTKIVLEKSPTDWVETYREHYLYDGHEEIGALSEDDTLKNFRVLGGATHYNQPSTVAIELGKKIKAPLLDAQGNICRLVDPFSQKIVNRYAFSAFGEEKDKNHDKNPWRYAAKRFDPDLNLIFFGKRNYDPEFARWLTMDPAGFLDSLNLYQYALNNPFSYYDPDGEFVFLACIPFAVLFTPVALQICVDAIAVGIGCWGIYTSTRCAAEAIGCPYTMTEDTCHTLVNSTIDGRVDYTTMNRSNKKHREKNYPGRPKDLEKDPDWKETTHPGEAKSGRRVFENTKTGERIEYDKEQPGRPGHKGNDHYHRKNPNSKGDHDRYLDKDGNPVPDGHDKSHLYPPEGTNWA